MHCISIYVSHGHNITVGRTIFEDKKFRGFRGYLVNLENKYPRNFLYIHLDFSFNTLGEFEREVFRGTCPTIV